MRRLRDVGQKFATNRRTVILTAPKISIPAELASLVEFLELPLPDRQRLRQIIDEVLVRVSKTHTLQTDVWSASGIDAMADNLRGLTEEEAERAHFAGAREPLRDCPETVTDVLEAKKALLRRSEMLEFVGRPRQLSSVGGLDNLKRLARAAARVLGR